MSGQNKFTGDKAKLSFNSGFDNHQRLAGSFFGSHVMFKIDLQLTLRTVFEKDILFRARRRGRHPFACD